MKNTFVKVLSVVMALAMVMSSFVFAVSAAETGHTHAFTETVVEATCISKGHTVYTCECGYFYSGNPTDIREDCREEDLEDVPASAPTCTEPAYTAHKECKLCGEVYGKEAVKGTKPNGHTFELAITDPDCGVAAGMKQVCTVCGYEETQVTCPPDEPCTLAGHSVNDYVYVITLAPTCTNPGKADYVCSVEGCTGGYRDIAITKRGHDTTTVTTPASCLVDGSKVTTCSRCDYKDTQTIDKLGHLYDSNTTVAGYQNDLAQNDKCVLDTDKVDVLYVAPTCYQDGYQWVHCMRTGCECEDYEDAVESGHLKKINLPKSEAHVPVTTTVSGRTVNKYYYIIGNQDTIYDQKNTLNDIIAYFEANVSGFSKCLDTITGYTKCKYCGALELVPEQTRTAPGHNFESKLGNGNDEKVKTATGGNKFIDTKGWDIVYDTYPCAEGARNYAIRECKNCNYQDPTGSFYFTTEHTMVYRCDGAGTTCNTTKKVVTYDGTEITVNYCTDCTHAGREYICHVCSLTPVNATCTAHNWVVKTANGAEVVVDPATCKLPAKYTWVCTNVACEQTVNEYKPEQIRFVVDGTDADGDGVYDWGETAAIGYDQFLNADNHEPYNAATTKGVQYVAPKCNEDGFKKGFCTWCSTNVNVNYPKGEAYHDYSITLTPAVTPNCMETGNTAEVKCSYCADVKGGELLPRNYNNHKTGCTVGTTPAYTRYATCTTTYADMYQYSLCKTFKPMNEGQKNPANHVKYTYNDEFVINGTYSTVKTVAAIAPDCTTAGIHLYTYCEECDYVVDVDTENCIYDDHRSTSDQVACGNANHGGKACANIHCTKATHKTLESYEEVVPTNMVTAIANSASGKTITKAMVDAYYKNNNKNTDVADDFIIAALGHNFWFDSTVTKANDTDTNNILLVKLFATCTAPGNEWKIQCNRCTAIDPENNGETILPHGVDADKFHRFDSVLYATCTENGHKQGIFCDDCSKAGDPHGQACSICNGNDYVLTKTGHTLVQHKAADTKDANCVEAGFIINKCCNVDRNTGKECYLVNDRSWIGYGSDYTPALGADNHDYVDTPTNATCATGGYVTHVCSECGDTYVDGETSATGHKDANGNTLLFNCRDYLYNRGVECAECGEKVTVDANGDVIDGLNNEFIDHNYQVVVINPGCEVDGETYEKCADCGHIKQAKDQNTGEWSDIRTTIRATGHDVADVVEEKCVAATPEHDGLFVWICGNCGGEFEKALRYTRNVEFDLSVVPYIDGKNSADLTFVNGGFIEVLVTVSTEDLVFSSFEYRLGYDSDLLTFVSAETIFDFGSTYVADNGDNVSVSGWFSGDKTGTFDGLDVEVLKVIFQVAPGVNTIDNSVLGSIGVQFDNAATETINRPVYNGLTDEIELALMGDLNADGQYSMEDVKLIKDLVGGEYNNVADIDNNGIVNIRDYGLLVAFVTSNQTIADYYAMFGIDIVALADAYDHNDYDASGEITNVDAKIFRDVIIEIGQDNWKAVVDYELGDFTDVLESIDYTLIP